MCDSTFLGLLRLFRKNTKSKNRVPGGVVHDAIFATDPKAVGVAVLLSGHRCPGISSISFANRRGLSTLLTRLETGWGRPAGRGVWPSVVANARFSDVQGSGVGSAGLHHTVA